MIGAAALVVAAGAAVSGAMAAGAFDPSAERQAYLDDVAKRLGVTSSRLQDALKAAAVDRIDAALAAGRISKDEAQALKDAIEAGKLPLGLAGLGVGFRHYGMGLRHGAILDAAASYLGLSERALRDQLWSGKSLSDVAKAQGKSVNGLKSALVSAIRSNLDEAVKDGRLTSAQRDRLLSDLESRLDALVTTPASGPLHVGGARGWGGPRFAPGEHRSSFPADPPPAALPTA